VEVLENLPVEKETVSWP